MAGIPYPPLDPILYSVGPVAINAAALLSLAVVIYSFVGVALGDAFSNKLKSPSLVDHMGEVIFGAMLIVGSFYLSGQPLHQITVGPIALRWYALAYLAGFLLGWQYCLYLARKNPKGPSSKLFDDFLIWAVMGTVLGGRLGYVIVYQPGYYFSHLFDIFAIWHGGMSFHGGLVGVIASAWIYTNRFKVKFFSFTDVLSCVVPIGLFFGRLANFVNVELYGRVTSMAWGVVFPCRANIPLNECPGSLPRHPSQLYEALLEGVILFLILFFLSRKKDVRDRSGYLSGLFLFLYGLFRFVAEFFREPDIQLGFLLGGTTMGQLLSVPMVLIGLSLIVRAQRKSQKNS